MNTGILLTTESTDHGYKHSSAKVAGQFHILPQQVCKHNTNYLIAVISHVGNTKNRNKIRKCLANPSGSTGNNQKTWRFCKGQTCSNMSQISHIFVTGRSNSTILQKNLEIENIQHDDIVQGHWLESYRNLVYKSILLLEYSDKYCKKAKYILKIDENVDLNWPIMENILKQNSDIPRGFVLGYSNLKSSVMRAGKWYVLPSQYGPEFYPPQLAGPAYVISSNAVSQILRSVYSQPLVRVEDSFVTGICRDKSGVEIRHNIAFCNAQTKRLLSDCATHHRGIRGGHFVF